MINMVYPSDYENKTGFDRTARPRAQQVRPMAVVPLLDGEGFSASAGEIAHRLSLCSELQGDIDAGVPFRCRSTPDA